MENLSVKYQKTGDLIPYVNNTRTHSPEQVKQIASSIQEFGFTNPILVDENNGVIAGHGRIMAAEKLGLETVPTICLAGLSEAKKKAYIIADNKMAENAGWNEELLKIEIESLKDFDFNIDLLGFSQKELTDFNIDFGGSGSAKDAQEFESKYTNKITTPIYEPKGEQPKLDTIFDLEKYKKVLAQVEAAGIPKDVKEFLKLAATRHIRFNYEKIAEFYCHQNDDVKRLFEASALVIIDYDSAIENGYIQLSEKLMELSGNDENE